MPIHEKAMENKVLAGGGVVVTLREKCAQTRKLPPWNRHRRTPNGEILAL